MIARRAEAVKALSRIGASRMLRTPSPKLSATRDRLPTEPHD